MPNVMQHSSQADQLRAKCVKMVRDKVATGVTIKAISNATGIRYATLNQALNRGTIPLDMMAILCEYCGHKLIIANTLKMGVAPRVTTLPPPSEKKCVVWRDGVPYCPTCKGRPNVGARLCRGCCTPLIWDRAK